jgi:hypothetical protein
LARALDDPEGVELAVGRLALRCAAERPDEVLADREVKTRKKGKKNGAARDAI